MNRNTIVFRPCIQTKQIAVRATYALMLLAATGQAQADQLSHVTQYPASLCVEAVHVAEQRHHLPRGLLLAISQVESGRPDRDTHELEPWPWTVQAEDRAVYFDTKSAAVLWVRNALDRGITSIDTGCLQINLAFHPRAFGSLDAAFDPHQNADYAARFLLRLYAASGDWRKATGSYHSQTTTLAQPYEARVERTLGKTGFGWTSSSKTHTLLSQLADAWRATQEEESPSERSPGNNWGILLGIPRGAPGWHYVPPP